MNELILRSLQTYDSYISNILDTSTESSLYKYNGAENKWDKLLIEGTFYLCKRSIVPFYCFLIMNNNPAKSLQEKLTKDIMIQLQEPFLLYKRAGEVKGILFKEANESQRLATKMSALLKDISNNVARDGVSGHEAAGRHQPQSVTPHSATSPSQNSIIRMLHSAAAKQSPSASPKQPPNATDVPRARPQGVTVPQQHQPQPPQILGHAIHGTNHAMPRPVYPSPHSQASIVQPAQSSAAAQNAKSGHWSNKTTSISVDYLFKSLSSGGQRSPPRATSPQQPQQPQQQTVAVGLPAVATGPPVSGTALTLSEVEQQALAEASERLRQQLGISGGSAQAGDHMGGGVGQRKLMTNHNVSNPHVLVDEEEEEDALVLTPNMMPSEQPGAALMATNPTGDPVRALSQVEERPMGPHLAAMTKEQLRMALITLLEEDDDFLNQIHEGYIRSLQRRLK